MATDNLVASLDIGTTKIAVLVGEMDDQGDVYVIGHGVASAEGLRRGVVVDMDKTVKSITSAVKDAQMTSGVEIDTITVGIAGEHVRSINSHGVIAVSRSDNEITAADVQRAIDAAKAVAIPVDREIIHVVPQAYSVDDQSQIKDPVGMAGVRLEVEAHIVTASVTSAKNIYRALERCQLSVDHMVLEGLATSKVLLTDQDMESGCALIDIGGDITNVAVFYDGAIRHTAVIPYGGKNVSNDIAIGLRTGLTQAEELKIQYGAALASMVDAAEMIAVPGMAGRPDKDISRNVLASIIEPRVEEILSLVGRELKKSAPGTGLTSGVILTGGGSRLIGTVELAEQLFDMPVRLGRIGGLASVNEGLDTPSHSTVHGLLLYGFENEPSAASRKTGVMSWLKRLENWMSKKI